MLKKRVIFTLLYDKGYYNLSRNFRLQNIGDIKWLKQNYNFSQISNAIDELILLNVSRDDKNHEYFFENLKRLNEECFIPDNSLIL